MNEWMNIIKTVLMSCEFQFWHCSLLVIYLFSNTEIMQMLSISESTGVILVLFLFVFLAEFDLMEWWFLTMAAMIKLELDECVSLVS